MFKYIRENTLGILTAYCLVSFIVAVINKNYLIATIAGSILVCQCVMYTTDKN